MCFVVKPAPQPRETVSFTPGTFLSPSCRPVSPPAPALGTPDHFWLCGLFSLGRLVNGIPEYVPFIQHCGFFGPIHVGGCFSGPFISLSTAVSSSVHHPVGILGCCPWRAIANKAALDIRVQVSMWTRAFASLG